MLAIMGANGDVGRATIRHLRGKGARVRGITRDPVRAAGRLGPDVELAMADRHDAQSLAAALRDAEGALVMLTIDRHATDCIGDARAHAEAIAAALRSAGVPRILLLSSIAARHCAGLLEPLHELEKAVRATGAATTILRAASFMENWAAILSVARRTGFLPSPQIDLTRRVETVSVNDVGRVAGEILEADHMKPGCLSLVGPRSYSPTDVGNILATLLDRRVTPLAIDPPAMRTGMLSEGYSPSYIEGFLAMTRKLESLPLAAAHDPETTRRGSTTLARALEACLRASE